jgi:hypothetical protein
VLLGDSSERVKAQGNLGDVAAFKQVSGLENFFFWDSVLLDGGLESAKSYFKLSKISTNFPRLPLNIFHQLEVGSTFLNLLDTSRCQFVGKFAQNNSILQDVFVVTSWNGFTQNSEDPFEDFLFLFLVASLKNYRHTWRKFI